jgi:hypothetical protein
MIVTSEPAFIAIIFVFGFIQATQRELFVSAAIVPAI